MTHRIQPGLSPDAILVVLDYPASQCALARIREPDHATAVPVAERFELYLGPLELANGYHELADARSAEHTSELQSLMSNSYAASSLKKKTKRQTHKQNIVNH